MPLNQFHCLLESSQIIAVSPLYMFSDYSPLYVCIHICIHMYVFKCVYTYLNLYLLCGNYLHEGKKREPS